MIDYVATAQLIAVILAWTSYGAIGGFALTGGDLSDSDIFGFVMVAMIPLAPITTTVVLTWCALKRVSTPASQRRIETKRRELEAMRESRELDEQIDAELDKLLEGDA